ncbi:MAG: hypothetical protein M1822_004127 [Bathelium mastoideum]|nr:MAG: hypothetical protein M1822_004127 [Bathelium mastoideum]
MPATSSRKRAAEADTYEEDDFVENDDGRATKKSKKLKSSTTTGRKEAVGGVKKDKEGSEYWELSKTRRVGLNEFKGKKMISFREYFEKDGEQLPTKKGISLPMEQFETFLKVLPVIERTLREKGVKVPRPKFDDVQDDESNDANDEDENGNEDEGKKKNFEATSEED